MHQPAPHFLLEDAAPGKVAGIDEAGRGPLAGPVVAACVYVPDAARSLLNQLNDSKKLSAKKRQMLAPLIRQHCAVGVGIVDVETIDSINILQATKLAMQKAYDAMNTPMDLVLIDGNQKVDMPCAIQTVVKGDATSCSIAAASIIAKVQRDTMMQQLDAAFPHYGWAKNAGYGTKIHMEALATHGATPHHRRSFAPVKKALEG